MGSNTSTNKVIAMNALHEKHQKFPGYDIKGGVRIMENKTYVTKEELEYLKENIDLQIETSIKILEGKIESLPDKFENMLLKEREYRDNKTTESRRYLIGTIVMSVISIGVSILSIFLN